MFWDVPGAGQTWRCLRGCRQPLASQPCNPSASDPALLGPILLTAGRRDFHCPCCREAGLGSLSLPDSMHDGAQAALSPTCENMRLLFRGSRGLTWHSQVHAVAVLGNTWLEKAHFK